MAVIFSCGAERLALLEAGFKRHYDPLECWTSKCGGFIIRRLSWMDDSAWEESMRTGLIMYNELISLSLSQEIAQ